MASRSNLSCVEQHVKGEKYPSLSPSTGSSYLGSWLDDKTDFKLNTVYGNWPKPPRVLLTNTRSVNNKRANLTKLIETDIDVQRCDIMFFTETWLTEGSDDFKVEGFNRMLRADRDKEKTGKSRRGGLCALMKDGSGATLRQEESVSDPNYELTPFLYYQQDHPKDIPPLIFILAYIPGPDFKYAKDKISEYYKKVQMWSNGGPIFLLGDFNRSEFSHLKVSLRKNARSVEQYVTCLTRKDKFLDKCYGNISKLLKYKSTCKRPLCSLNNHSDHNIIILSQENMKCKHTDTEAFWER